VVRSFNSNEELPVYAAKRIQRQRRFFVFPLACTHFHPVDNPHIGIAANSLFRLKTCHDLNVGVVAKPAEDWSPLDTLRGMSVDYAQVVRQEVLLNL